MFVSYEPLYPDDFGHFEMRNEEKQMFGQTCTERGGEPLSVAWTLMLMIGVVS